MAEDKGFATLMMDEVEANNAVEFLTEECGFWYDEDITCIYGAEWKITGLRFLNVNALLAYIGHEITRRQLAITSRRGGQEG